MGGIGHELALCPERRLQPGQQAVEGVAEFLQLIARPASASRACIPLQLRMASSARVDSDLARQRLARIRRLS